MFSSFWSPKPSLQSSFYHKIVFLVILWSSARLVFNTLAEKTQWMDLIVLLQIMEKLVDIVHFLHLEIYEAFGSAGMFLDIYSYFSVYTYLLPIFKSR